MEVSFFKPVEVGRDKVQVPILQFADDTLFLGDARNDNIAFLSKFINLLELTTGLTINRGKCSVIGIGVENQWLENQASALGCSVGKIPFTYLGLKVGSSHKKIRD